MNFNNIRIGLRLGLGFGAVLTLMCVIVFLAYSRLQLTGSGVTDLFRRQQSATLALEWASKTQQNVTRTLAIANASGRPEVEQFFGPQITRTSAEISELQKKVVALVGSDEGKALLATVAQRRTAYIAMRDELLRLLGQADQPAADALMKDKLLPAADAYLLAVGAVKDHELRQAEATGAALERGIASAGTLLLALLAASLTMGTLLSLFITRSVTRPLAEAVTAARVIANCDLSHALHSDRRDELGDLLRALGQMQGSLSRLVAQLRGSTDSIGTASAEIAVGTLDLSTRTEQTASNLQQTASAMAQLTGGCGSRPTRRARRTSSPTRLPKWRRVVACWCPKWWPRWTTSMPRRRRSPTSSAPSTASPSRPTSWRSTRRWKPRVPVSRGAASRSWPAKCARSPDARRKQPARSRA